MKIIRNDREAFNQWLSSRHFDLPEIDTIVKEIVDDVKKNGDLAVTKYTQEFDGILIKEFCVSEEERIKGEANIESNLKDALDLAYERIKAYHMLQLRENNIVNKEQYYLEERISAIESVGIYVPGGKAAYPSTVLMNGVPAQLAGVENIIMITPPCTLKASLLYAARLVGVKKIYTIGGAQGIAALAYGTQSIEKVNKIVGPGNIYVSMAKKLVSDCVGIDMIAGPSEVLILADETSNIKLIAADMIAQAEHDERASAMLITTSEALIKPLLSELKRQIQDHPRASIINKSIDDYGMIALVKNLDEAYRLSNLIAPEHLEVLTKNPSASLKYLKNAGAIFLGDYTPEALGDYMAGPNHTLPTQGTSKFASPLSVDDFIKKTSIVSFTKVGFDEISRQVMCIAEDEGLIGHKMAVKIRSMI